MILQAEPWLQSNRISRTNNSLLHHYHLGAQHSPACLRTTHLALKALTHSPDPNDDREKYMAPKLYVEPVTSVDVLFRRRATVTYSRFLPPSPVTYSQQPAANNTPKSVNSAINKTDRSMILHACATLLLRRPQHSRCIGKPLLGGSNYLELGATATHRRMWSVSRWVPIKRLLFSPA